MTKVIFALLRRVVPSHTLLRISHCILPLFYKTLNLLSFWVIIFGWWIFLTFAIKLSKGAASFASLKGNTLLVHKLIVDVLTINSAFILLLICTRLVLGPVCGRLLSCLSISGVNHHVILTAWSEDVVSLHVQIVESLCIYPTWWNSSRLVELNSENVLKLIACILTLGLLRQRIIFFLIRWGALFVFLAFKVCDDLVVEDLPQQKGSILYTYFVLGKLFNHHYLLSFSVFV